MFKSTPPTQLWRLESCDCFRRDRVWINGILVVCGAFLFFLLVSGCILKIGRDSLCNSVIQIVPNVTRWVGSRYFSDASTQHEDKNVKRLREMRRLVTGSFFFCLFQLRSGPDQTLDCTSQGRKVLQQPVQSGGQLAYLDET